MMLLPLIQDFEFISDESKNENKKKSIYNYIYLKQGNKLLKFDVWCSYSEILKILEKYTNEKPAADYRIMTHKEVIKNNIPFNVIPYLGKFRLQGNYMKTDNYLVPKEENYLFSWLCDRCDEITVVNRDLEILYNIAKLNYIDEDYETLKIIKRIIGTIKLNLVGSYTINSEQIEDVKKLIKEEKDNTKLQQLKWILKSSKENKKYIKAFGLEDKFLEVAVLNKQKVKS